MSDTPLTTEGKKITEENVVENKIQKMVDEELQKFNETAKKPTVMILGATGCGKSTLINTLFGISIAKAGIGAPITEGFQYYGSENLGANINFVDSEGWETDTDYKDYIEKLKAYIKKAEEEKGITVQIIWYCISVAAARVQEMDLCILEELMKIPEFRDRLCVVFTKCDEDTEDGKRACTFQDRIHERIKNIKCFQISNNRLLELDKNDLIDWSANCLDDEDMKKSFIAAQTVNLKEKHEQAKKYINATVAEAVAIAALPMPFADAIPLAAIQVKMLTQIGKTYGMSIFESIYSGGGSAAVAQLGKFVAKFLSKAVLGNIAKTIPGIGSFVGTAINGTVAAAVTYGIGTATSEAYYTMYKKIVRGEKVEKTTFNQLIENEAFKQMIKYYIEEGMKLFKKKMSEV